MATSAHSTSDLLDTAMRRAFVLRLRKAGGTYEEIALKALQQFGVEALPKGWDERYAWKDVKRELDKLREEIAENAEDVRQLELQRLDDLLKGLWPKAANVDPDYQAVDRVLKLMERRARLVGLDAPDRHDLTTGGAPLIITEIVVEHPAHAESVED